MIKVLVVTPSFPPTNGADMHRIRTSLPYFRQFGYEPLLLTLDPASTTAWQDQNLNATVPDGARVWRASGLPERFTGAIGLRNAALRSMPQLLLLGNQIIEEHGVSLVYFSTTAFPVMTLGRYWLARYRVPYLLDFQDPWYNQYYARPGAPAPPGGRLKYGVAHRVASVLEPFTLRRATHVISVSPAYPVALRQRYSWMQSDQFTVLPFGAPEHDFDVLDNLDIKQDVFDAADGNEHWVYIGRAGADMAFSLRAFFTALSRARAEQPARFERLRLHFVGTDYAIGDRAQKTVEPVAQACGVPDIVHERPHRIPYFEALQCLREADALIVPGSDDPGYTASKIYPYILARKPLLAVFHEQSSVVDVLTSTRAGTVVTFRNGDAVELIAQRIRESWFSTPKPPVPDTDWSAFKPYTAREMTRKQCAVFDACIDRHSTRATK